MDPGILRYRLLTWWSRRWDWPGMWLIGEALDRIETCACRHLDIHTARCGRGDMRHVTEWTP